MTDFGEYRPNDIPDYDPYGGPGGAHTPVYGDVRARLPLNEDAFGTLIAERSENRIDVSSEYDFNVGRHRYLENGTYIFDVAGSTTFDDLPGKFQVTANAGDEHVFGARELIRYVPGYEIRVSGASWAESALTDGQHYAIELGNATMSDGYRYHFEGTPDGPQLTLEQYQGDTLVNSVTRDLATLQAESKFDHTAPAVAQSFINWYGAGLARYTLSFPVKNEELGEITEQRNVQLGSTANKQDIATNRINLRTQVRVWADVGADPVTVNVGSLAAVIRGGATEVDREKPATFYDLNGDISQYPTDNVSSAIAARIDPNRAQTAVKASPPLFQPGGTSILMGLSVYAVHNSHPDLTVNFNDPDDDGTDEGPSPAAQTTAQNDVMQYTRDVTSIPTTTDIRADGTTGLVPDMRLITSTIGQSGGGTNTGGATGGEIQEIKRNVYPNDVVIFLPRTDPAGTTTSGTIRYLKAIFVEDW